MGNATVGVVKYCEFFSAYIVTHLPIGRWTGVRPALG